MNLRFQDGDFANRHDALAFAHAAAEEWDTVAFIRFWTLGPGRDRNREGDDSARATADGLMRTRGWFLQTVDDAFRRGVDERWLSQSGSLTNAFRPPPPPNKRQKQSSARRSFEDDGPVDDDEAIRRWHSPPRIGRDVAEKAEVTEERRAELRPAFLGGPRRLPEHRTSSRPMAIAEVIYP